MKLCWLFLAALLATSEARVPGARWAALAWPAAALGATTTADVADVATGTAAAAVTPAPPPPVGNRRQVRTVAVVRTVTSEPPPPPPRRAAAPVEPNRGQPYRRRVDAIPVECMQRQIDTGEHISDDSGTILYEPFPVCKETGHPLALPYHRDVDTVNCTIALSDHMYHLLQLYIHQDAPWSCRVAQGKGGNQYVPFVVSLGGQLEQSHLDVDGRLNVILTDYDAEDEVSAQRAGDGSVRGYVKAATSYNVNGPTARVIIGDELTLQLSVRWFPSELPHLSSAYVRTTTVVYCLLTAALTFLVATVYFLGVVFPKRARTHFSKAGGELGLPDIMKRD
ncbi:uncharacterized protein V1510DRAFT_415153 [Dipodascopsis tothii]|uniref:uncharacterized protein n=1 Tax=Dipodascopsis tothii TaxID=44089 RepID=UPI0034CF841D